MDTTQFVSGDKELGLVWNYVANNSLEPEDQLNRFSSPACPGGGFRYMLSHIWSKSPNIIKLG